MLTPMHGRDTCEALIPSIARDEHFQGGLWRQGAAIPEGDQSRRAGAYRSGDIRDDASQPLLVLTLDNILLAQAQSQIAINTATSSSSTTATGRGRSSSRWGAITGPGGIIGLSGMGAFF